MKELTDPSPIIIIIKIPKQLTIFNLKKKNGRSEFFSMENIQKENRIYINININWRRAGYIPFYVRPYS